MVDVVNYPAAGELKIARNLSLPLKAVTEKLAFLGRTGSGKSYAASKLAELMLEHNAQVIVLDPVGIWFGIRLSSDGKGKGFEIPVFGGLRGDLPLEATAGALVADIIIDRGISAVLDVSQFLAAEQARFATDFATRFFQRKKAAPSAVHIFIEECQEFIPQNVMRGEERVLHAFERLLKLGRNFGIGASLISQRPQEVNKKALNQAGTLFVFHMTGPQERKAIESWVADKGVHGNIASLLPKLQVGQPHVWSPQWLGVSIQVQILKKRTFDASSTPEVGALEREVCPLAPIDVEKLKVAMAATIERAKAEDPRELRKRIAALERDLVEAKKPPPAAPAQRIAVPVLTPEHERRLDGLIEVAGQLARNQQQIQEMLRNEPLILKQLVDAVRELRTGLAGRPAQIAAGKNGRPPAPCLEVPRRQAMRSVPADAADPQVGSGGLRRILIALAQRPQGLSTRQLGVRASLSSKSGSFHTYLSRARSQGWIDGSRDRLTITDAGLGALGPFEPLPTGKELLGHWMHSLGTGGATRILSVLAATYPEEMSKIQLSEAAGLSGNSGSFHTYLSRLRALELIEGRSHLRASDELFE